MKSIKYLIFLIFIYSCSAKQKIIGKWEFINAFEGEKIHIDSTLFVKNSNYGNGILEFKNDYNFASIKSNLTDLGTFNISGKEINMKYEKLKDSTKLKISFLNSKYLLLSNFDENKYTWFYRKINKK